jgi:cellulose synthase/poly-beta-1,6-N-acetylglucosamine synthase-like glycosyltransferase/spore germination protein YaaH/peptidoglycan/xylan/chitin deacetylase (PgdA/CDA1 family)
MSRSKQVFETSSKLRWKTFQWFSRVFIFLFVLTIPVAWIAYKLHTDPQFVSLSSKRYTKSPEISPPIFTNKEAKKFTGFDAFLRAKQKNASLIAAEKKRTETQRIRASFYVDWDPQAYFSLQSHIADMNMVLPEWFFIDSTGKIISNVEADTPAYNLMKNHNVKIVPMLSNFSNPGGDFDGEILHKLLSSPDKKSQLINDIFSYLEKYKLQGINLDFEEVKDKDIVAMHKFIEELYAKLHSFGYLVTQDILPNDDSYDVKKLGKYEDYIFLMAYDQHWDKSVPGPISDQKWIEKETAEVTKNISPEKLVLCLGAFGYDWPDGDNAEIYTYQHALSTARIFHAPISFGNNSYNCSYSYTDNDSVNHQVYFIDAAGNFNTIRFADEYGAAGVALWRLGSEDERIWNFYSRDLDDESLEKKPFNFSSFSSVDLKIEKPDFFEDGEVLDVVANPQKGIINMEVDSSDLLVGEEYYKQLPTRYVINRFGEVTKKDSSGKHITEYRVVLTFDDGPDPNYTPRILDILKRENIPAAFFIVGMNAESNLPILKRISREGYEIGNHSFTHPNMATISGERAEAEMEATRLLIEAFTGRSTILFRAPYNADAEPSTFVEVKPVERGKVHHYYTVGESIDPEDWDTKDGVNADSIFNRVVRQYNNNREKGIILLHDAGGNREATVRALPRIIQYFKSIGVKFATIGEILNKPKDVIMPPVHSESISMSSVTFNIFYWVGKILFIVFWAAIMLGLVRIAFMGVLAILQYRRSKIEQPGLIPWKPGKVCIIVPAYNEEVNALKTIENLLIQDYENIQIIFVDDGSTDGTYEKIALAFSDNDKIKIYTKPNGGKASALNFGIEHSDSDYIVCIDADTQLLPNAVSEVMKYFRQQNVGAVAGNVKVGNEKNILTKWQSIEYTTAQNFDRRAFDLINCITVVPGALGAFKKEALLKAGGFTSDTLAEDCDLTIRILRQGYVIRNCTEAIAVTEAPETVKQFMGQRFRWNYGVMQSFWKNKDACFKLKHKSLGWVALPSIFLFQIVMPIIAPLADLLFILSLIWNRHEPESIQKILSFYILFLLVDIAVSILAFSFEKEKLYKLIWLIPQRFIYRQLMYVVLYRSIKKAIKGETQSWGKLNRTGNVKLIGNKSLNIPS